MSLKIENSPKNITVLPQTQEKKPVDEKMQEAYMRNKEKYLNKVLYGNMICMMNGFGKPAASYTVSPK